MYLGRILGCALISLAVQISVNEPVYAGDDAASQSDPTQPDALKKMWRELRAQQQKLDDAQRRLTKQMHQMEVQQRQLQKQQEQINAMRAMLATPPAPTHAQYTNAPASGARKVTDSNLGSEPPVPTVQYAATDQSQPVQQSPVGQPPPQQLRPELADVSLASQGGVLTPKGVFSFEPQFGYQYSSNNQFLVEGLNVVPGITIGSENVRSLVDRMITSTLGGRLGVTDRFEVEAEVPYVFRADATTLSGLIPSGTVLQQNAYGYGIGDVQFGGHYQINNGADGWPYFVANLLVKSDTGRDPFEVPINVNTGLPTTLPTGTGFWAFQPSITAIYPSDPVVFFVNVKDIYQIPRHAVLQPSAPAFITSPENVFIAPGNAFGASIGMGFGINEKASFSLAFEDTVFLSTYENGVRVSGSTFDIGDLDLGFNYVINPRISINLGVQIGATKAAPDASVLLRIPIKFQVF
jgi:hypothetical protein